MILKRLFIYLGLVVTAAACYQYDKPEKPKNLISKEKMVDVLIDIKLITSANGANRKIMDKQGIDRNTYVFTKHHIDSAQFAASNNYYAYYIKDYEAIYNKVNDSLEALKAFYTALELKEKAAAKAKKKQDSINLAIKRDSLKTLRLRDSLKIKPNLQELIKKRAEQ